MRVCVCLCFFYSLLLTTAFLSHLCFVQFLFFFRRHKVDGPSIVWNPQWSQQIAQCAQCHILQLQFDSEIVKLERKLFFFSQQNTSLYSSPIPCKRKYETIFHHYSFVTVIFVCVQGLPTLAFGFRNVKMHFCFNRMPVRNGSMPKLEEFFMEYPEENLAASKNIIYMRVKI